MSNPPSPGLRVVLRGDVVVERISAGQVRLSTREHSLVLDLEHEVQRGFFLALRGGGVTWDERLSDADAEVLRRLRAVDYVVSVPSQVSSDLERVQRVWFDSIKPFSDAFDRIGVCRVTLFGCGGTGALVAQGLAAAGVRKFELIDPDLVNESNLNRQYPYRRSDIGRLKIECLAAYLADDYKIDDIVLHPRRIDEEADLAACIADSTLLICGADQPLLRVQEISAKVAAAAGIAVLFGSVGLFHGVVGPLLTNRAALARFCRLQQYLALRVGEDSLATKIPSNGATNALVAQLLVLEATKFVSGCMKPVTENRMHSLSFSTYELTSLVRFA